MDRQESPECGSLATGRELYGGVKPVGGHRVRGGWDGVWLPGGRIQGGRKNGTMSKRWKNIPVARRWKNIPVYRTNYATMSRYRGKGRHHGTD